jgi:hypothetical protein
MALKCTSCPFRAAYCVTDHYLIVTIVMERLAVSKQRLQRFHMERFCLRKLNMVEGKGQYHFVVSNRFAAVEDMDVEMDAWEMIRESIKISAKESLDFYE